jgi:hypothetical protein
MSATPAVDEGGATWIDVRYGPLVPQGDYHIGAVSTAIGGATIDLPAIDFDGEARVSPGDIGADEYVAP